MTTTILQALVFMILGTATTCLIHYARRRANTRIWNKSRLFRFGEDTLS